MFNKKHALLLYYYHVNLDNNDQLYAKIFTNF